MSGATPPPCDHQRLLESTRSWPVTGVLYPELIKVHLVFRSKTTSPSSPECLPLWCGRTWYLTPDHLSVSTVSTPRFQVSVWRIPSKTQRLLRNLIPEPETII
ncbi:hypothetical protein ILYODFUR_009786 [Ilyodon furcidens]|uniref:Uncharacterized protein n=1 Tax=Ilyodon furcidens TaxID=33524 RepID=A0ABV0TTN1_9TELE